MGSVALVDVVPGIAHAVNFGSVVKLTEESFLKFLGGRAGDDTRGVHVGIACAGETEVDDADDFVVVVEEDITEVEVAVDEVASLGLFNESVVGVDVLVVVLVVELFQKVGEGIFDLGGSLL